MRAAIAVLCACAVASVTEASGLQDSPNDIQVRWTSWRAAFGKVYSSVEEEKRRFATFASNIRIVDLVNQQNLSYTLAANAFADMTPEEYSILLGLRGAHSTPSLDTHRKAPAETLPKSVDWRAKGAVNTPEFQGICGSCWSFSTTGSLEGAYQIATGTLLNLSEQQLVDCAGEEYADHGCGGGDEDKSALYAQDHGLCTEEAYPYSAVKSWVSKCKNATVSSCKGGLPKGAVKGFKMVSSGSEQNLMSAVAQQPVATGVQAASVPFMLYSGGVLSGNGCGTRIDHAVLTVGYGTDAKGGDYWIVKNSFGPSWGESGYIRIQRTASGKGVCGILQDTSYPVIQSEVVV